MRLLRYYIRQDPLPNELRSGGTKGLLGMYVEIFHVTVSENEMHSY